MNYALYSAIFPGRLLAAAVWNDTNRVILSVLEGVGLGVGIFGFASALLTVKMSLPSDFLRRQAHFTEAIGRYWMESLISACKGYESRGRIKRFYDFQIARIASCPQLLGAVLSLQAMTSIKIGPAKGTKLIRYHQPLLPTSWSLRTVCAILGTIIARE